jgi:hypothetical protein
MSEVLQKFEELAKRARAGDAEAKRQFYDEAARLFPADFGKDHPSHSVANVDGNDGLDDALAIIRQSVSTGG